MKTFAAAAIIGAASAISEIESAFLGYITQFGKSYANMTEYNQRLEIFAFKHQYIQAHNAEGHSYKLGHNKFSDWTEEEYNAILTYKPELTKKSGLVHEAPAGPYTATPIDWRTSQCMQPIQDQGQCGSCWAFSATAAMESDYCIKNGTLYKLSEQQLVDCVKLCFGCNGGNASLAFNYLKSHNQMSETAYPYTATDTPCAYNSGNTTPVADSSYVNVTADTPSAMQDALASYPLSVAIQANQLAFQLYSSGIFSNTNCGTNLDHATNVVGWGTSAGVDYWIMRNSWGTSWGE